MDEIQLIRQTMLCQELIFKEQVGELHRLYRRQKILMEKQPINPPRDESLCTRDLLSKIDRQASHTDASGDFRATKRQKKTFDLEEIPGDNDEDAEYVCERIPSLASSSSSREKSVNFSGIDRDLRDRPLQEMALFPTLPSDEIAAAKIGNSLDWQLQVNQQQQQLFPWITQAAAQSYSSASTVRDPWKSFLTGESYRQDNMAYSPYASFPQMPTMSAALDTSYSMQPPYSLHTQEIFKSKNALVAANNGCYQQDVPSNFLRSSWLSSGSNAGVIKPPSLGDAKPLKLEEVDTITAVSNVTGAASERTRKTSSDEAVIRNPAADTIPMKDTTTTTATTTTRLVGATCTAESSRNLDLQDASTNSVVINSGVVLPSAEEIGLNSEQKARTMEDAIDLVAIDDSVNWAAAVLVSFSGNWSSTLKACQSRQDGGAAVQESSKSGINVAMADVKLLKSCFSMLRRSKGKLVKPSRKLVASKATAAAKEEQQHRKGKTIAALIERSLETGMEETKQRRHHRKKVDKREEEEEEDEEEEEEQSMYRRRRSSMRESVHSNESAVETMTRTTAATPTKKSKSLSTSWLWGDVTRRKRMRRPRQPTLRPQLHQVRCQN